MIKNNLVTLSKLFEKHSPLFIVGGYIRDKLMGLNPTDVDLCSALKLTEVEEILKGSNFNLEIKNKQFGTARIYNNEISFEYSVFRKDYYSKTNLGKHSPNKVEFVNSLKIDSERRDFTINALYYNLTTNELIDLYNAKEHIEKKIIKMICPITLNFDGERILRLARFVGFGFKVEEETLKSAKINTRNVLNLNSNIITKYLTLVNNYPQKQRQKIKEFLLLLNLKELAQEIN